MEFTSENLSFGHKDTFLHMTIFISIKTLYSLRTTCKRINQWLSDPNTFSWKQRIRNTFPNSYEDVLKQTMEDQIRELLMFDELVEAGYFVCCSKLICSTSLAQGTDITQVPWQNNLFVFTNSRYAHLYDSNTTSVLGPVDLGSQIDSHSTTQVLFNINDRKIGFFTHLDEITLFHLEGTELIFEQKAVITCDEGQPLSQMYGDCVVFKEEGRYLFYSISSNSVVFTLGLPSDYAVEALSTINPLVYTVYYYDQHNQYFIKEINFLTHQSKDPIPIEDPKCLIEFADLVESDTHKYLKMYGRGSGFTYHLYDLQHYKPICSRYSDFEMVNNQRRYGSRWLTEYSPDLRSSIYYNDKELHVCKFQESIVAHDNVAEVFSKKCEHPKSEYCYAQWITNDIISMFIAGKIRYEFISMRQRRVIGWLAGDSIVPLFRSGDKAIAFDLKKGVVYSIHFAPIDDRGVTTDLKRKLEDADEPIELKKQKLDHSNAIV